MSRVESAIGSKVSGNGVGLASRNRCRWFPWFWQTWLATGVVAYAMWDLQTDSYPLMQNVRPDWYVYGWPICFATSGRGRFNFYLGFKTGFLILDLFVAALLVACTAFAIEALLRRLPKLKPIDVVGLVVGISLAAFVISDQFSRLLTLVFGSIPPKPEHSPVPGDIRLISRMDEFTWKRRRRQTRSGFHLDACGSEIEAVMRAQPAGAG